MNTTPGTIVDLLQTEQICLELTPGLHKDELVRRMSVACRLGDVSNRALAFYLADMKERRVHQELGYRTTMQFAINRLHLKKRRAQSLIATGQRLNKLKTLDAALERGEITWSKVRSIARIACPENEGKWLSYSEGKSHEQIDAMVSLCHEGDDPPDTESGLPQTRFVKRFTMDQIRLDAFELAREKLMAECDRTITDDDFLEEAVNMILNSDADGSLPGRKKIDGSLYRVAVERVPVAPDSVEPSTEEQGAEKKATPQTGGWKSVHVLTDREAVLLGPDEFNEIMDDILVTKKVRKRILERDGQQCLFCHSKRSLMIHHTMWSSHGGSSVDNNLMTLCGHCHGRVHDEYLFISGSGSTGWTFFDRQGADLGPGEMPQTGSIIRFAAQDAQRPLSPSGLGSVSESDCASGPGSASGPRNAEDQAGATAISASTSSGISIA